MTKLPFEVEAFAKEYFAAESRAVNGPNGKLFRKVDQKDLALKCKSLLESSAADSMTQLCIDLNRYKPGVTAGGHNMRLSAFANRSGVRYPLKAPGRQPRKAPFDLATALSGQFALALRHGLEPKTVRAQTTEVLEREIHKVQVSTITPRLQGLLRETGLSREQLANIVSSL